MHRRDVHNHQRHHVAQIDHVGANIGAELHRLEYAAIRKLVVNLRYGEIGVREGALLAGGDTVAVQSAAVRRIKRQVRELGPRARVVLNAKEHARRRHDAALDDREAR